jgi:SAM-dependent methyltransferase
MPAWFSFRRRASRPAAPALPELTSTSLPKPLGEIRRLDDQHFALRTAMQGNFLAPLTHPGAILDVGCGTGRWAMEMAWQFPDAQVVGVDLVFPTPEESLGHGLLTVPANVRFQQADATHPLPFADQTFDFTYLRLLYNSFPALAWNPLLQEVLRVTRPGGWIESLEALPISINQGPGMTCITNWAIDIIRARGCNPVIAVKLPEMLRALRLQQVTQRKIINVENMAGSADRTLASGTSLVAALRQEVLARGIAPADEYDRIAEQAKQELVHSPRAGFNTYVVYGQKPE